MLSSIGCADGSAVVHDMLISAMSAKQVAESRGMTGLGWEKFYRMRFLECLGTLAVTHGAKGASGAHTQPRRYFFRPLFARVAGSAASTTARRSSTRAWSSG